MLPIYFLSMPSRYIAKKIQISPRTILLCLLICHLALTLQVTVRLISPRWIFISCPNGWKQQWNLWLRKPPALISDPHLYQISDLKNYFGIFHLFLLQIHHLVRRKKVLFSVVQGQESFCSLKVVSKPSQQSPKKREKDKISKTIYF